MASPHAWSCVIPQVVWTLVAKLYGQYTGSSSWNWDEFLGSVVLFFFFRSFFQLPPHVVCF